MKLIEQLASKSPVITDGAWGTQLQACGLEGGNCPDQWNLSHPDLVARVPRAFAEAGSQVVLTNTFRSNPIALSSYALAEQTEVLNRKGVEISREAVPANVAVFATMGPCGKLLVTGEVTAGEITAAFEEQSQALADAGADALVIETMAELEEAELALQAAKTTKLPVVACVVFDSGPNYTYTMMGNTPEEAAERLAAGGADVVGANCGQGIEGYIDICRRMRAVTHKPIWIKANAGMPQFAKGEVVYETSPKEFASHVPELVSAGAQFVGGCCGTGPDYIAAIREELGR